MCGKDFHFDNYHMHWRFLYVIWAILIFITYPFVIIGDMILGNNDILFVSPEELENKPRGCCSSSKENKLKAYYRKVMHRPVYRIVVHHFMELIFLVTLSLVSIDPLDQPDKLDVVFYDYVAGIIMYFQYHHKKNFVPSKYVSCHQQ